MDDASAALQQILDRQAIADVISAYCRCVDVLDAAGVAALFTEDCTVDYGPAFGAPVRGTAALAKSIDRGLRVFAATSHHVSNIEMSFADDGSSASVTSALIAWHRYADGTPDAILWGRYEDRFAKHGERWLIAERTLRVAGQQGFDIPWLPIGRASTSG